jgi:hypothetical protein
MTQKDYIAVAQIIRDRGDLTEYPQAQFVVRQMTLDLALMMKSDNRRFDAGKFFDAAGYPELTGTKQGLN